MKCSDGVLHPIWEPWGLGTVHNHLFKSCSLRYSEQIFPSKTLRSEVDQHQSLWSHVSPDFQETHVRLSQEPSHLLRPRQHWVGYKPSIQKHLFGTSCQSPHPAVPSNFMIDFLEPSLLASRGGKVSHHNTAPCVRPRSAHSHIPIPPASQTSYVDWGVVVGWCLMVLNLHLSSQWVPQRKSLAAWQGSHCTFYWGFCA